MKKKLERLDTGVNKTFYEITGIRLNNVSLLKLFGVLNVERVRYDTKNR